VLIREALERTRGNRTRAAKLLDLSHRALLYKIRDYGLGE
jgi:two-component system response regulator AtoC